MGICLKSLAGAALALTVSTAALAQDGEGLNFGIISTESSQNLRTVWEPFLAAMEAETGLEVNPFFASDYAGIIEGMRFGKVDLAWYGNKSAMEAVDRAGAEIFAQSVDSEGNPGYWSVLVAHVDSPLETLDDVLVCDQSLDFGNGDPNSTSGFLVPSVFVFAENGIDPAECFDRITNANHETNLMAVANEQVDIATNNTESMRRLQETRPEAAKKLKVIWKSPLIPSDPIAWREDLDGATKASIMSFFMSYGRQGTPDEVAEAREILTGLGWAPFRPSSDAQLYPIRILELSKEMAEIEADENMSAEEKAASLDELKATKVEVQALMETVPQS